MPGDQDIQQQIAMLRARARDMAIARNGAFGVLEAQAVAAGDEAIVALVKRRDAARAASRAMREAMGKAEADNRAAQAALAAALEPRLPDLLREQKGE